jgi:hypothetical protein
MSQSGSKPYEISKQVVMAGVGVAGVGGEVTDRVAELFVGRPAERGGLHLPGLPRRRGDPGERGEGFGCGEPGAAVPDLGQQPGRAQRLGARQGQEDVGVGVLGQQVGDVRVEGVDRQRGWSTPSFGDAVLSGRCACRTRSADVPCSTRQAE